MNLIPTHRSLTRRPLEFWTKVLCCYGAVLPYCSAVRTLKFWRFRERKGYEEELLAVPLVIIFYFIIFYSILVVECFKFFFRLTLQRWSCCTVMSIKSVLQYNTVPRKSPARILPERRSCGSILSWMVHQLNHWVWSQFMGPL